LDRRIGDQQLLAREVQYWEKQRNKEKVKICWRFTKDDARMKLKRHYDTLLDCVD
jgi:hypothetical protein